MTGLPDKYREWDAKRVLDAVEEWAQGYWMIRETGAIPEAGRFDALLVPVNPEAHCFKKNRNSLFWERPRLVGIEVKVRRADFLAGLKRDQYGRYDSYVSGLYIATMHHICEKAEIPKGIGWLVVHAQRHRRCVCVRHPKYSDTQIPTETAWRLFFDLHRRLTDRIWQEQKRGDDIAERIGKVAATKIFRPIDILTRSIKAEFEDRADGESRG